MRKLSQKVIITLAVTLIALGTTGIRSAYGQDVGDACGKASDPPCNTGLLCDKGTDKCQMALGQVAQPYGTGYGAGGLGDFLNNVISAALTGAGLLLFLYLVYGGIMYMSASGDEKAVDKARKTITNALIGLVIIATSYFIARILETILGINILKPTFTGP